MLSRTADNLYWLARYVERAEYLARILETSMRLTTLPLAYVGSTNEWETAVATAGCRKSFFAHYTEANEENVTEFLAFSIDNPSSIRNCIEIARQNARAVRTALTIETWETIKWRVARAQALRQRATLTGRIPAFPALGAGNLVALRRVRLPHHAAQRRLLVFPARPLHRARRQHRAYP